MSCDTRPPCQASAQRSPPCKDVAAVSGRHCKRRWRLCLVGTPPCLLVLCLFHISLVLGAHVEDVEDGPFEAAPQFLGHVFHDIKAKGEEVAHAVVGGGASPGPAGALDKATIAGTAATANTTVAEARAEHKKDGRVILVAITVPIRRVPETGAFQVRTQTRHVIDKAYDPLYDGTLEAVGESLHNDEPITDAIWRGLEEEMGVNSSAIGPDRSIVVGADDVLISSCQPGQDSTLSLSPYVYSQQLGKPAPWVGLGFAVVVPPLTKALFKAHDDEVDEARWWDAKELLDLLEKEPAKFMGFHYPVFLRICRDLVAGRLQSRIGNATVR